MQRWISPIVLSVAVSMLGCGVADMAQKQKYEGADTGVVASDNSASMKNADNPPEATAAKTIPPGGQQKMIYTGTLDLVVKDFSKTEAAVNELVEKFAGHVTDFRVDRTYGTQLTGHWVVRIPVERFAEFMGEVAELGVPESKRISGQDVTLKYVDLEARLKNESAFRDRLRQLITEHGAQVKDLGDLEDRLHTVQGNIESMEAEFRVLKDRIAMTTVTITAREQRDYKPPQAPTFGRRIADAWWDSLDGLRRFGENLVVFLVYVSPCLVILLMILAPPVWLLWRWCRRRCRSRQM